MPRLLPTLLVAVLVTSACAAPSVPLDQISLLPAVTPDELRAELDGSPTPVVVNIWASWCAPCRSEAPLLRAAAAEWSPRVEFIGVAVRDDQEGARGFIAEYGLTALDHRFDATGAVPAALGGVGVPLTYFFRPGGELAYLHRGVIDERTLALWIAVIAGND